MLYVRQAIRLAGQALKLPGWPNWVGDRSRQFVLGLANPRARFRRRLPHALTAVRLFGCYMVKPHGQLVSVSSTPHSAYTPDLSTS